MDEIKGVFTNEYIMKAIKCSKVVDYINLMQGIISCKSQDITNHCIRVSMLSYEIGKAYNLKQKDMENLIIASSMHDIGKIFIPDDILNKISKLSQEEYEIIKTHSRRGYEVLEKIEQFRVAAQLVLHHHERCDGKGYPNGLYREEIPLLSRIITITDAFDAMISQRTYKEPMSIDDAIKELQNNRDGQFDGEIVDVFVELIRKDISLLFKNRNLRNHIKERR
ncbi:HD-GYP domain-containing protein [Oceanirhabdus sp. W0125-5]|uniref:HD-GYP domain-containing protein n=1 Tax=Oceanirhabdus sp. W0125-5 TaxID=2999116 RepID=UPI0022F32A56|nr:HD domain-containing phosphohydrolase [Oceanirhabdus sp. W0125-5]WBW96835.1 HD domain-containing protein [Oceanirhabdus sp. W0125-5]